MGTINLMIFLSTYIVCGILAIAMFATNPLTYYQLRGVYVERKSSLISFCFGTIFSLPLWPIYAVVLIVFNILNIRLYDKLGKRPVGLDLRYDETYEVRKDPSANISN